MPDPRIPVLLYDGECGLCNAVVRFILRHDREGRIHFAPLQSAPAQDYLRSKGLPQDDFDSLVFVPDWSSRDKEGFLLRTAGALASFASMGRPWAILAKLEVIPVWLRDAAYKLIAKTRYALFGEYEPRPLENQEWEKRFLAR
ncbi:MAG TPA: DCC1-like thiol-disulfide oxidoreductase family protein [Opitutaceae bacterium]|jgi:predicted DCC family thiol-disulfide oxidoreductase YuxK|nr:DCC1-like thiol-disulfide oxidoreductase family protein [Opitutaceae bacterium]